MFNLEKALATWRRSLEHRRVFQQDDLDELEQHVRDQVQGLMAKGRSEAAAFGKAMQEMGTHGMAEAEYQKVYWGKVRRQHQTRDEILWRLSMLKNYIKIALRNSRRQKGYTFINIVGLSVGLACSFFILLWATHESSYDRFHTQGDQLYQVMRHVELGGQTYTWSSMPMPLADVLEKDFPEVADAERISWPQQYIVTYEGESFREPGHYADSAFFQLFTFPLLQGNPATVLADPTSVAISAGLAERLFGTDWQAGSVLGRALTINHGKDFTIAGVFEDVPDASSLQFEILLPVQEFVDQNEWLYHWGNSSLRIVARLKEGASSAALNEKIAKMIDENHEGANATVFLHPYKDLYLRSNFKEGRLEGGRIEYVRIFLVVAVFLLLIACINFMNLATARSMQRAREIGVRKVVGASRKSLVGQFLGESMLIALLAFGLAALLVIALLPFFNDLTGKAIALGDLDPVFLLVALGLALLTGLLAGSYPALYLSSFDPIGVLRSTLRPRTGAAHLRKALVVFQFTLSILLIVGTLAVYEQVEYIRTKSLGLDRENVIYMPREGALTDQYDAFKQELLARPGIASVTASNQNPLSVGNSTTDPTWEGKDPDDNTLFYIINANHDFVETMNMEVVAGRAFSPAFATDSVGYLINERTAEAMGMDDPIGASLEFWGQKGHVVGVVKDFHMSSLYAAIEPTIVRMAPERASRVFVRAEAGRTEEALASLEAVQQQFNPAYPFRYEFLDAEYEETYRSEVVMGTLANIFALIAMLISCLGLLGLASYTAERRTKEIGIRKVLGASAPHLVLLLSRDFTRLVLVAFLIAAPVAYYLVQNWLDQFAYRVELGFGLFIGAGVAALVVAWLTVSYQSARAALANPVKTLRYE